MAKRTRGTSRPGQRRPIQRPTTRPETSRTVGTGTSAARPSALTPDEEARAAALEARIVDEERAAETQQRRNRDRGRRAADVEVGTRTTGSFAVRAADEYQYVVRDVRRIVIVAAALLVVLIALWVVLGASGAGRA
jgi:hypothetical protein